MGNNQHQMKMDFQNSKIGQGGEGNINIYKVANVKKINK
jgi:hypothetical protein